MNTDTEAVVDASAIVAAVVPEKHSEWVSGRLRRYGYFHVLDLTYYEVSNSILNKVSKKELTGSKASASFSEALKAMALYETHSFQEIISDSLHLASSLGITAYDCAYLLLARKFGLSFLTLDTKLAKRLAGSSYLELLDYPK